MKALNSSSRNFISRIGSRDDHHSSAHDIDYSNVRDPDNQSMANQGQFIQLMNVNASRRAHVL